MGYEVIKHSNSGKARPYIFENARRDPQTGQVIVRFNGGGDRNWVEVYMRRDDPMNTNYSEVVQWLKERFAGKVGENFATRIARGEIEKAARKVVEMETSRSSRTNIQQTMQNVSRMTSNAKKKYSSVRHSLFTEVFDEDDYLKHSAPNNGHIIEYFPQTVSENNNGALVYFGTGGTKFFDSVGSPEGTEKVYYASAEILKASTLPELKSVIIKGFNNNRKDRTHKLNDRSASKLAVSFWEKYNRKGSVTHSLYTEVFNEDDYLTHHGILGMKWGVRRYQNEDGSLTPAGAKRYGVVSSSTGDIKSRKGIQKRLNDIDTAMARNKQAAFDLAKDAIKTEKKYKKAKTEEDKQKLIKRMDDNTKKVEELHKNMVKGREETQKLLEQAKKNNYNITMKDVMRDTSDGRDIARSILLSGIGLASIAVLGVGAVGVSSKGVKGTKYKVSSVKDGEHAVGIIDKTKSGKKITVVSDPTNSGKGMYAIAPAGTLSESTRVTGKEEAEFWKALGKQLEEEEKRKER